MIAIDRIIVNGDRVRKDMGSLDALAESIRDQGLLQAIGITEDNVLVFGERRLRACRDILGWTEIEAKIVHVTSIVEGEFAENEVRKSFSASERVAIAAAVEAEIGERRGNPHSEQLNVGNPPQLEKGNKTRDLAAELSGFSSERVYRDAKKVVESGNEELIKLMDGGAMAISTAAKMVREKEDAAERRRSRKNNKQALPKPAETTHEQDAASHMYEWIRSFQTTMIGREKASILVSLLDREKRNYIAKLLPIIEEWLSTIPR